MPRIIIARVIPSRKVTLSCKISIDSPSVTIALVEERGLVIATGPISRARYKERYPIKANVPASIPAPKFSSENPIVIDGLNICANMNRTLKANKPTTWEISVV
jgi:hypothetical protein